jgi:pilus assembly protein CpaE
MADGCLPHSRTTPADVDGGGFPERTYLESLPTVGPGGLECGGLFPMYPFPVVLVGLEGNDLPGVRRELTHMAAEVESEFPSAAAAVECLRPTRKQQRLFIVQVGDECDTSAIERLCDEFGTWPILGLVGPGESTRDILKVNRAGASQIVTRPLVREDFHRAVGLIGAQFGRHLHDRHVFAVAGAVGGSGTSTIAINLAFEIAQKFRRSTILAELSPQVGSLASLLDIHPRVTLAQLLKEIHRVDDLMVENSLVPVSDGLKVLVGAQEVGPNPAVEPAHLSRLIACFRKIAQVSVLDVPDMFHGPGSSVLDGADRVLLVGVQNIPSIRSLKLYCQHLSEERLNHSVWVAINRYNPQLKGYSGREIQEMLGVPRLVTIANDFRAVSLAINHGKSLRQVMPSTPILHGIDALIHGLLGLERRKADGAHRLFGRVLGALAGERRRRSPA